MRRSRSARSRQDAELARRQSARYDRYLPRLERGRCAAGSTCDHLMKPIQQPQAIKIQQNPVLRADNLKADANKQAKLEQAAEEFEAVLVHQLLQSMQTSLEHGSIFGGSNADRIYGGIGEMELAKNNREVSRLRCQGATP